MYTVKLHDVYNKGTWCIQEGYMMYKENGHDVYSKVTWWYSKVTWCNSLHKVTWCILLSKHDYSKPLVPKQKWPPGMRGRRCNNGKILTADSGSQIISRSRSRNLRVGKSFFSLYEIIFIVIVTSSIFVSTCKGLTRKMPIISSFKCITHCQKTT